MNINDIKNKIYESKTIDDIMNIENEFIDYYRNKLYNNLLEDDKISKKLCEIFNVDKDTLNNVLVINGYPPLDDFKID